MDIHRQSCRFLQGGLWSWSLSLNEVFIMDIDRVVDIYREAFGLGLSISLSICHLNCQENFSLSAILGPECLRHPQGGCRQRSGAALASAIARSLPLLVQSHTIRCDKYCLQVSCCCPSRNIPTGWCISTSRCSALLCHYLQFAVVTASVSH